MRDRDDEESVGDVGVILVSEERVILYEALEDLKRYYEDEQERDEAVEKLEWIEKVMNKLG